VFGGIQTLMEHLEDFGETGSGHLVDQPVPAHESLSLVHGQRNVLHE
jgi:hypothetical protein